MPGELTFAINAMRLTAGLAVSDAEVMAAMRFAFTELKLVVEPGGAVALAALLSGKAQVKGQAVALILSGRNVDPVLFHKILS
jgi:threonine dehydratase